MSIPADQFSDLLGANFSSTRGTEPKTLKDMKRMKDGVEVTLSPEEAMVCFVDGSSVSKGKGKYGQGQGQPS